MDNKIGNSEKFCDKCCDFCKYFHGNNFINGRSRCEIHGFFAEFTQDPIPACDDYVEDNEKVRASELKYIVEDLRRDFRNLRNALDLSANVEVNINIIQKIK